ncbi:uncharacterized protein LTHEOB_9405 [Neofusicoccum parvum]|nr:uncharacterized protein LTHEOB_9405 [Neofusicoccum parvum]
MRDNDPLNRLLTVLRDRRIPLARDDVQWAFESVKTQDDAAAWVDEYLHNNTLLTKEELELYEALCEKDERVKERTDLPEVQPIQDEDLRAAIESLETSTAAIDQQTKALEVQMDALLELRTQNAEPSNAVRRKLDDRKKKNVQEKGQLDFNILASIEYMTNRLHFLTTHATDLHAHTTALAEISAHFTAALPPPAAPRASPYKQAAAARARAKSTAATPISLSAATQQLLRQLDISLPPATVAAACQALAQASLDCQNRLLAHFDSSQLAAVRSVGDAVGTGAVEVQEILEALFVNSAYATVAVTRPEVEEMLKAVEKGIGEKCLSVQGK